MTKYNCTSGVGRLKGDHLEIRRPIASSDVQVKIQSKDQVLWVTLSRDDAVRLGKELQTSKT